MEEEVLNARDMLNRFAGMRGWSISKLIGWSDAADFADWYAEQQAPKITDVARMIHFDLARRATVLMKQNGPMRVEDFRELPEVKKLWNAMDIIEEYYL